MLSTFPEASSVYSTSNQQNYLVSKYIFILTASSEISTTIVPTAADVTLPETSEITKLGQESVLTPSLISLSRESSQQFNKKVIYWGKNCYNANGRFNEYLPQTFQLVLPLHWIDLN